MARAQARHGIVKEGCGAHLAVVRALGREVHAYRSLHFRRLDDRLGCVVIDHLHQRVYTNLGKEAAAIDLNTHAIVARWTNGCEKSRGDAIDEQKGFLFVSCGEGKTLVFDLNHNNSQVDSLMTGPGVDVISYNSSLAHLYVTGAKNATISVLGVPLKVGFLYWVSDRQP